MKASQWLPRMCAALVIPAGQLGALGDVVDTVRDRFSGPKIEVTIDHPPTLPLKVSALAIAKPEGQCGEDLGARVEEDFLRSGVTVIDRQRLEEVLKEHRWQASQMFDQQKAAKVGQLLGAQALLFLKVFECKSNNRREESYTDKDSRRTVYNYVSDGVVRGQVRVVDLTTGRVLAAQHFRGTSAFRSGDDYPGQEVALTKAHEVATESIHKMLLPWSETKSLVFFEDKQCNLKEAGRLLKIRDFDGALTQSTANLSTCRETSKAKPATVARAYYNLGMLQFVKGDYDAALVYLNEADKIESAKVFQNAIKECREAKQLAATLAEGGAEKSGTSRPQNESASAAKLSAATDSVKDKHTRALEERLGKLDKLLKSGIITQQEYDKRRAQMLDEL